ncbi:MAG TPA: hypothetical protein VGM37_05390 [Armatimonadota bacterium]|jgi:tetratricopeptide (TPR) repeat protein
MAFSPAHDDLRSIDDRAVPLFRAGRYAEVVALFRRALAGYIRPDAAPLDADSAPWLDSLLYRYWNALDHLGKTEAALKLARKVYRATGYMRTELECSLVEAGKYAEAERLPVRNSSDYADLMVGLAFLSMESQRYEIACSYFARRLAFLSSDFDYRHLLNYVGALILAKRSDEARFVLTQVLEDRAVHPRYYLPLTLALLALALTYCGRRDEAQAIVRRLCRRRNAKECCERIGVRFLIPKVRTRVRRMMSALLSDPTPAPVEPASE